MPFKLEPLTTVTIKETGGIRTTAFADNPAAWAVRPNNNSPEVQEWAYEKNLKTMQKPNHYFIGVRDDATGELVAYAHWRFSTPADRAKEAREDKDESEAYAPGCVREAQDEMNRGLDRSEEEVMGNVQDYWHLHMLATKRPYQGKGAGKMLLQWGQQRAKADHVLAFLDATERGKPLYEKMGFVAGREWNIDYKKYGVDHWNRQWPMTWTPS